jgi:hypothetical protein
MCQIVVVRRGRTQIARAVVFLAANDARAIIGSKLSTNGGGQYMVWCDALLCVACRTHIATKAGPNRQLYEAWSGRYGVRNSFYRFMNEVLPPEALGQLLDSIEYLILNNPPEIRQQKGDDDKKKRWLFDVRNRFTHSAQVNRGYHPAMFGELPAGRTRKQTRYKRESREVVNVEGWPQRVIEAVQ